MAKIPLTDDSLDKSSEAAVTGIRQPQLVKHRPMIADPVVAPDSEDLATAPIVNRGAKKITPVTPNTDLETTGQSTTTSHEASPFDAIPTDEEKITASEQSPGISAKQEIPEVPAGSKAASKHTPLPNGMTGDSTEGSSQADTVETEPDVNGTVASETSSADTVRQAELNKLITEGTYAAPISVRKSSRAIVASLSALALVLLLGLGDAWLDMGLLNVSGVPHTHFFSAKASTTTPAAVPTPAPPVLPAKNSPKITLTKTSIMSITAALKTYEANNKGTYPAELTAATLPTVDPTVLSAPSGVSYTYKVLPAGCTTIAHTCTSFTLIATDVSTHNVIASSHL